jgi:hypothetical protein
MTPEERKGIEELLTGYTANAASIAWLWRQLEHNDWDESIERMGGGPKARDAYMNPIFDAQCAVTAFDMRAQLTDDGRERGLWIWLFDESKARAETYDKWVEQALAEFCRLADVDDKTSEKFRLSVAMDEFKRVANAKVHEAALLEWSAVKRMYDILGKTIAKHEAKEEPIKARTPRKLDRRGVKRRLDDKRKARLKQ